MKATRCSIYLQDTFERGLRRSKQQSGRRLVRMSERTACFCLKIGRIARRSRRTANIIGFYINGEYALDRHRFNRHRRWNSLSVPP
ncbi:MAG: hypothetical protein MZU97_04630 [Bacillus subtilis]|nr:hypothetical protein [Bacillus subtilis]